jgi:hypothetical protein
MALPAFRRGDGGDLLRLQGEPQFDRCAGHDGECVASVVLQRQEKLRRLAVAREMKLLDAAVSHEHAISSVVAARVFGEKGTKVSGSVRQESKEQFTVCACGDGCASNENFRGRIEEQVDLVRFTQELRSEFEPLRIVWRVGGLGMKLNAFEGYENMFSLAGGGASLANLRLVSGNVHHTHGRRKRTRGRRS